MKIAIDFDGTIVEHRFPDIGPAVPMALDWMHKFQQAGAELILWTMRSDGQEGHESPNALYEAVIYCERDGIRFDGINQGIGDRSWTNSPKAYANIYIDDAAFGCPLIHPASGARPFVDWSIVGPAVYESIKSE